MSFTSYFEFIQYMKQNSLHPVVKSFFFSALKNDTQTKTIFTEAGVVTQWMNKNGEILGVSIVKKDTDEVWAISHNLRKEFLNDE